MTPITALIKQFYSMPRYLCYRVYDQCFYRYLNRKNVFYGWGIHLFTGKFGKGKTSLMTILAHEICVKYPQVTILTNLKITNFPEYTKIIQLKTAQDILNAPKNTLVLIDEIGTLFNSRDFCSGKNSVPKPVFQHLCQCRKRHMMIYATVQRFNLLDKQIRDITATVCACDSFADHPFTRRLTGVVFDIDEYEAYCQNPMYNPRVYRTYVRIQTEQSRRFYDTTELIQGFLTSDYLSDEEILRNRGEDPAAIVSGDKDSRKAYKRRKRW